jgi:8-oxo-dGTP pyrophosphatase MutT (NUDIX family)
MDKEEIRARLRQTCMPAERMPAEHVEPVSAPGTPAVVLIGLLARPEGPSIILTQRSVHVKNHAAEISLPGGRMEAGDDGPAATALREAFEEIGLARDKVELLGCLSPYETISGFRVYPVVGWIEPPVEFALEAREVEDVFQVPLSFVLDPANHRCGSIVHGDERRSFYVLPYPGRRIWGVTAGILVDLARVLAP